jgi:hypothetical protein
LIQEAWEKILILFHNETEFLRAVFPEQYGLLFCGIKVELFEKANALLG